VGDGIIKNMRKLTGQLINLVGILSLLLLPVVSWGQATQVVPSGGKVTDSETRTKCEDINIGVANNAEKAAKKAEDAASKLQKEAEELIRKIQEKGYKQAGFVSLSGARSASDKKSLEASRAGSASEVARQKADRLKKAASGSTEERQAASEADARVECGAKWQSKATAVCNKSSAVKNSLAERAKEVQEGCSSDEVVVCKVEVQGAVVTGTCKEGLVCGGEVSCGVTCRCTSDPLGINNQKSVKQPQRSAPMASALNPDRMGATVNRQRIQFSKTLPLGYGLRIYTNGTWEVFNSGGVSVATGVIGGKPFTAKTTQGGGVVGSAIQGGAVAGTGAGRQAPGGAVLR